MVRQSLISEDNRLIRHCIEKVSVVRDDNDSLTFTFVYEV